jgi:ribosomal-protein-alanine N-acetyltransferase
MQLRQRTVIEEMTLEDVPAVQDIEREIFLTPWPRNAYRRELLQNKMASYIVLRDRDEIIGYAGLWKMHDEAHVTTVGVRRKDQGRGFGMALMLALISRAYTLQSRWMTLEVRASNYGAMALYEKLGFKVIGRRRGYYTVVMWSDSLLAPAFKERFAELRERYAEDIAFSAYPGD